MFVSAADNNVYVKEEWDSLPSAVSRVTGDGVEGEVYNGIPDWVYEEEVLGTNVVRLKDRKKTHLIDQVFLFLKTIFIYCEHLVQHCGKRNSLNKFLCI